MYKLYYSSSFFYKKQKKLKKKLEKTKIIENTYE